MYKVYNTQAEAREAAKEKSAEMRETWETVDFAGNNCAESWDEGENCDGWDGNDYRCGCGNRRVSWVFSEYPKGSWRYYAEAY